MDTVIVFNTELSGLYDTRPPISKAKMASITRGAMKAIKFYKHVVQSVEKFILKCKPEYKIPGLYVIDSIVRQSRHQFGAEKDVFAPRFARNMQTTFANLFRCAPEDKSKIIRVLNLWQKNSVFAPEVIQPLFDFADPNHPIYLNQPPPDMSSNSMNLNSSMSHSAGQDSPPANMADDGHTMSSDMSGPITIPTPSQLDSSTIRQLQQLQQFLIRQTGTESSAGTSSNAQDSVKFNKKLLDYDYDEDEEEEKPQTPRQQNVVENNNISQLLNDPNVLRQLQNLQKLKQQEEKQSKLTEMRLQEEAFEKHLATVLKKLPFANECDLSRPGNDQNQIFGMQSSLNSIMQQAVNDQIEPEVELVSDDGKVEVINLDGNSRSPSADRDRYNKRRRSRSRSKDRSGGVRRRRSRTRSRSPRSRRRVSRDRDRDRAKDKDKEREKEREYERERRRKGLPDIKKEHLSVCSTTLWVGHLSKLVHQEELSDTFMKYGDIVSIDMIHPRGCAYIVMNRRQDAFKAMSSLKNYKLQGRAITISWAAGKGVKSKEWKDYWDLELGVSYVPWNKFDAFTDFEALEEGGMFDEDTMPELLKEKIKAANQKKEQLVLSTGSMFTIGEMPRAVDTTQPPPRGPPQMMQNVSMVPSFPMGAVPRLMPPMGMHMPPNIVPGMPLGVPPPQMMMAPPAGMIPGLPHMTLDKSVPPPSAVPPTNPAFMTHFPPMHGPMPPQMQQLPPAPILANNTDDHMDIDMDDEPVGRNSNNPLVNNTPMGMGLFNRPPPQMFGQAMPGMPPIPTTMPQNFSNKDTPDTRDRRRDRSNSRDRRSRDRDRDFRSNDRDRGRDRDRDARTRDRDRGDRDRDRRNEYSRDRDRNSNQRWGNDRGRSRDNNDMSHRDRRDRDRTPRDRNDREKSLQDRLREMAGDSSRDFNRRRNSNEWRDRDGVPPPPSGPHFPGNFIDQGIRNVRPMNIGPMGGPPPLNDMRMGPMDNPRGPPPGPNHRGEFDYNRGDDFDRRGPPRDFFGPNRFGPPGQGPGPRGPMGMLRGGPPPFGPRMGAPMFMRGPRPGHPGPPGPGFNDRPFFDGYERDDRGSNRGGRGNNNMDNRRAAPNPPHWNDRDDDRKSSNRFEHNDQQKDNKRSSSRWGNTSPKSVVSEEDCWDSPKQEDTKDTVATKTVTPLPQTEPIDDDSQEDDFNDFDESAPLIPDNNEIEADDRNNSIDEPIEKSETINPNSFDIFANDTESRTEDKFPVESKMNKFSNPEVPNASSGGNTTPLYDEPNEKIVAFPIKRPEHKEFDESPKHHEPEPEIPGVDPETSD